MLPRIPIRLGRSLMVATCTGMLMMLGFSNVHAQPGGGGGSPNPTCSIISPTPPPLNPGDSVAFDGQVTGGAAPYDVHWDFQNGSPTVFDDTIAESGGTSTTPLIQYNTPGIHTVTFSATDSNNRRPRSCMDTIDIEVLGTGANDPPVANDDLFNTPVNTPLSIPAPGVLGNDNDPDNDPLTVSIDSPETQPVEGTLQLNADGSFLYTPNNEFVGQDMFTYWAWDGQAKSSLATVTINVTQPGGGPSTPKNAFNILMNYELGMHCTGFEFAYCCVLPPYNSILAQVVKTDKVAGQNFPRLLEADDSVGLDFLGRPTVLRDLELDGNNNFKKYMLVYDHQAQPRNDDPNGKEQSSTLISNVEGNSLLMWNTVFDAADVDAGNKLQYTNGTETCVGGTTDCSGAIGVLKGDGTFGQAEDNYANAWLNHFYIYEDLEGSNSTGTSLEIDKIRLGLPNAHIPFSTVLPDNSGPAFHPMGPGSTAGLNNVLTFSTDSGTVVYTQMKVLENLPVMLTSPRIWEALGLPLTPFEDTIDFFGDPGLVDEDSIRPYVRMQATLHEADCAGQTCTPGLPVLDEGNPVVGFGTAPIDIPNCERCHSAFSGVNAGNANHPGIAALVQDEINFWNSYYDIDTGAGDSDWYSRLKGAAISILGIHDEEHGTSFLANYPGSGFGIPQNFRLGHESVICQRCHADNVIAVVKSAECGARNIDAGCDPEHPLIPPLTEAIHYNHRSQSEGGDIVFDDALGRSGGCQGCHPAHRSDGDLSGYPITEDGSNAFAAGDNRDAAGGCFVGRDVHSNRFKDDPVVGGVLTDSHLNPVGQWLKQNVALDSGPWKGIWCTNCHQQFSQELWKAENVPSLIHAQPGDPGNVREPANYTLNGVVNAVNAARGTSYSVQQVIDWIDPKNPAKDPQRSSDQTHRIWAPDPGLCDHVASLFGAAPNPDQDGNVATIEVNLQSEPIVPSDCSTGVGLPGPDCDGNGNPDFSICGSLDGDGDVSVSLVSYGLTSEDGTGQPCDPEVDDPCFAQSPFCTTPDCVAAAQATLTGPGQAAVPVPFSAASDGRDHWLAPGEPHCADCHAAPYVEQSGNISAYPPFNYPRKASLNRYSRGHQDITCQGCHESIHGLYPVTPPGAYGPKAIDQTTWDQAANMNTDGSHGPVNCSACHTVNADGVYVNAEEQRIQAGTPLMWDGQPIANDFDRAASWAHTFTDEAGVTGFICTRCHADETADLDPGQSDWTKHAMVDRISRDSMNKAEIEVLGYLAGDPAQDGLAEATVCKSCHGDRTGTLQRRGCTTKWKTHLIEGRASQPVWEHISTKYISNQPAADGTICGW